MLIITLLNALFNKEIRFAPNKNQKVEPQKILLKTKFPEIESYRHLFQSITAYVRCNVNVSGKHVNNTHQTKNHFRLGAYEYIGSVTRKSAMNNKL